MAADNDKAFYARADAFIDLANQHVTTVERDKISTSLMYASARFNAWVSATEFSSGDDMRAAKPARIAYFVELYRTMLEENMESYTRNFADYMKQDD